MEVKTARVGPDITFCKGYKHSVMATVNLTTRPSKKVKLDALRKRRSNIKVSGSSHTELRTPHFNPSKGKEKETNATPASNHKRLAARAKHTVLPTSFKAVAGSYEKLLYGIDGGVSVDEEMKLRFHLKPIFIFPAHVSCIKAVAASPNGGKWLATGSTDEIIKVWDLKRRKEMGGLMHHEGFLPSNQGFLL